MNNKEFFEKAIEQNKRVIEIKREIIKRAEKDLVELVNKHNAEIIDCENEIDYCIRSINDLTL